MTIINNKKGIWQLDILTNKRLQRYDTIKEAALCVAKNAEGFKNISSCARGLSNTAYGYKWEYEKYEDLENEEWKSFIFEKSIKQNYFVSNYGRIKNKNRILKQTIDNNGYYNVNNKSVHIIVATIFIKNENNYKIVNHLDGNKLNNKFNNLQWTTIQGNCNHAISTGLRKNVRKVINIDNNNNNILGIYDSCMHASKILNVNGGSVNKCCKGTIKTCGINKLKFKYLDEQDKKNELIINNKKRMGKSIKIDVFQTSDNIYIETCNSITETSKKYKVNNKTISNQCDGKVKYCNTIVYFRYH